LATQWQLTASAYAGFRAPTLNELYRSFRLGNVFTRANEQLQAEHLRGGEAGIRYLKQRIFLSTTYFQENVDDPVANVTLSTTAAFISRQRENLGSLRARGVDSDALFLFPRMQLRAGYEYVHSVVSSFSQSPGLVGKFVPQVPSHTFTFSSTYSGFKTWTLIALFRASSSQFDDDLNQFELHLIRYWIFLSQNRLGLSPGLPMQAMFWIPESRQQQRRYSIIVRHALFPAASGLA
jgi:outer membrane receptor protein involved in Fe transport